MFGLSNTAIAWCGAYVAAIIFAFVHPIYGVYGYFLDYYGHPPMRWWGKGLPELRWSLIIALVTLSAFLIRKYSLPELRVKSHPQSKWFVFLLFTIFLITISPLAVWPEKSWEQLIDISKIGILYFLLIQIVRTQKHFRWLMVLQILGVFWWGWSAFVNPHRSAGRLLGIGGPDSFNDNSAAVHLLGIMPIIVAVFMTGKRWEKILCIVATPFVLNAFILCNSRGGLMGLAGVAIASLLLTSGPLRRKAILGLVIGGCLMYSLADEQFINRQQTIQTYEEDSSATSRIDSWNGALELMSDHPLGVGGGGFSALSPVYIPEIVEAHEGQMRDVHNTYLLAGSEWGWLGLFLFVAFLLSTLRGMNGIRISKLVFPEAEKMKIESIALMLGLIGVLVAGVFTSRFYAEVLYWLAAFGAILKNVQITAYEEELAKPEIIEAAPQAKIAV
jgi:probable O-glycosylation ligase (exosortase A-associated)